ncbi:MAG TPA: STAS domain-containing protein, partial [Candidatus Methylomirabilis sp.]|nr:STAS domain-containing protein [Candidatus Methylomirabilis sp.]
MVSSDAEKVGMSIRIRTEGPETVVEFHGKLDSSVSQADRERVLSVVKPGSWLVLDGSGLTEISSAGLRMLLLFCRYVQTLGATVSGTGVSKELKEIAEATGFARLFQQAPSNVKRPILPAPPRLGVDAYPTHYHAGYALRPGFPIPFGATPLARGINFSTFSRHASACTLVLFEVGQRAPFVEIAFPTEFRVGDVFAMMVFDLDYENLEYGFRMDGPF